MPLLILNYTLLISKFIIFEYFLKCHEGMIQKQLLLLLKEDFSKSNMLYKPLIKLVHQLVFQF